MDKKSKEALRRYKKCRQAPSSSSSSSSDTDSSSYSSSDSDRKAAEHHRKKKARHAASLARRSSSSSDDEKRKREKRDHCQKLEAKRNHLKRKLKEAKLKKRAAAAAAALSGHSRRALSPATQAKLKKLAERKHQRAASKERREREREKHRGTAREREREHHRVGSHSPTKATKIRIHQDAKRQKTPPRMHHQLMSREKIIIQTRTRDRTPSAERERQRHEHKLRHHDELSRERERREREREREAARDKERAEALARCQERQRERERLAREKLRREEEDKKYGSAGGSGDRGDRLLPRPSERELAIAAARGYESRERSLEAVERARHNATKRGELDIYDVERRGIMEREEFRREREYITPRHRELSPVGELYNSHIRDPRDLYVEEDRERAYSRVYLDEARHPRDRDAWLDSREMRERDLHDLREVREARDTRDFREVEHDLIYPDERECILRDRERPLPTRADWKNDWAERASREREWHDPVPPLRSGFVGGPKRSSANVSVPSEGLPKMLSREQRTPSEPDWDANEAKDSVGGSKADMPSSTRDGSNFVSIPRDMPVSREKRWQTEWHESGEESLARAAPASVPLIHHRSERGGRGFRRGGIGGGLEHGDRNPQGVGFRPHPPPLMTLPVQPPGGYHSGSPRFPPKRNMTYTNPNLIKKQQAALAAAKAAAQASAVAAATTAVAAAKAAAHSAANATTNPGILGQVSAGSMRQSQFAETISNSEKLEAGELSPECEGASKVNVTIGESTARVEEKMAGELSEISDSDDDILNKSEKKIKPEGEEREENDVAKLDVAATEQDTASTVASSNTEAINAEDNNKGDEDEMLDFEEISDGELEEDTRNKGVGDALGVDWASLIAETKQQADITPNPVEQPTSAKQKWQPHRVILDIGISMRMVGEDYAKRLLIAAQQKLNAELIDQKANPKVVERIATDDEDANIEANSKPAADKKPTSELETVEPASNPEYVHALACIQVAQHKRQLQQRRILANVCGPNSRALSARHDLRLRRQLCGLPAEECDIPTTIPPLSGKLKAMALAAFQRSLEVK